MLFMELHAPSSFRLDELLVFSKWIWLAIVVGRKSHGRTEARFVQAWELEVMSTRIQITNRI